MATCGDGVVAVVRDAESDGRQLLAAVAGTRCDQLDRNPALELVKVSAQRLADSEPRLSATWLHPGERDVCEHAPTRVASPQAIAAPNEAEVESEALAGRDDCCSALASLVNHGDCHICSD